MALGTCQYRAPLVSKEAPAHMGLPWAFSSPLPGPFSHFGTVPGPMSPGGAPVPASESLPQANSGSSREASPEMFIFLNVCAEDQADIIKSGKYHKIDK